MKEITKSFKYVDYLWDNEKADSLGDNQVELFFIPFKYIRGRPKNY